MNTIDVTKLTTRTFEFRGKQIKACHFDGHPYSSLLDQNEPEVKDRHWYINPGDVVLDVGAAHGAYTLTALALGAGKVIAWAPEDYEKYLKANLEVNGWSDRCVVVNTGLWEKIGFVRSNYPLMPIYRDVMPENQDMTAVCGYFFPVNTLDNLIHEDRIDWLKIDAEGAELEILKGGEKLLRQHKPKILVENHLFKDSTVHERTKRYVLNLGLGYREVCTMPYADNSVSHSFYLTVL